jgi:hypothetical protein
MADGVLWKGAAAAGLRCKPRQCIETVLALFARTLCDDSIHYIAVEPPAVVRHQSTRKALRMSLVACSSSRLVASTEPSCRQRTG